MSHNRGLRMRVSGLESVVNCKETGNITLRVIIVGSSCIVLYSSINLSTEQTGGESVPVYQAWVLVSHRNDHA